MRPDQYLGEIHDDSCDNRWFSWCLEFELEEILRPSEHFVGCPGRPEAISWAFTVLLRTIAI